VAEKHARPSPRGDATLERLLDGALEVYAERGYHAASVREICARSGVGIGTFYAHFEHKRELLRRVFIDRALPFSRLVTPADLLDHDRLVACLRTAVDDPVTSGLFRAWYEAVLEEPDIARFHAGWRASTLEHLAATVAEAQRRVPSAVPRRDPVVLAWTIATLARELGIHDRKGAPDLDALARLFEELIFGGAPAD
jgi:AcrR family transcriptional regulator